MANTATRKKYMKQIKIESYLPIFTGFYNTIFEPQEDHIIEEPYSWDDYDFDYEKYFNDVARECCRAIQEQLEELGFDIKIKFQRVDSPREYNFRNDSIDVEYSLSNVDMNKIINYLNDNINLFKKYLKEHYTSRSGFHSFHSTDSDEWIERLKNQDDIEYKFGSVLQFILENEGYDDEKLYYEVSDSVYLDGSLKEEVVNNIEYIKDYIEDYAGDNYTKKTPEEVIKDVIEHLNEEDKEYVAQDVERMVYDFYKKIDDQTLSLELRKGGSVKKNWIQGALSGGKNKGALRRTAMRKGLLRSEKEKLSKTDLHKLEAMGGKTAKRAYLAETLKKFNNGGELDSKEQELKEKIEAILKKVVPNFYHKVWVYKSFFGEGKNFGILISASDYSINNVRGQYPQVVSLSLNLKTLELQPQVFGGNGGQSIYREPNMDDPKEKYLAMKSVKIPFRTPNKNEESVLKAIEKFAENYKKAIKENIDVLKYRDIVDYNSLLEDKYESGGAISDELKDALKKAEGSNIFTQDFIDKYEIVKETYSTKKHPNAEELAKSKKKELQEQGYAVKMKKVGFSDLARSEGYFITAIREKKMSNGGEVGISVDAFEKKIKDLMKQENKWHFVNEVVDGKNVRMKFFVGKKEVDVQIFIIDNMAARMPRNYSGKRDTTQMIIYNFRSKMSRGGGFAKIDTVGEYLKIETLEYEEGNSKKYGNLKITLLPEGKELIEEMREDDHCDDCIMDKLFDDIRGNSELMYFGDVGEAGLGLSSAPCITDGYYYDDNGDLTDEGHDDSQLYYYEPYMIKSFIDEMLENGIVYFYRAGRMKVGGRIGDASKTILKQNILEAISNGREVSVESLTLYLGRKPQYEENIDGTNVRKCFLRPFYKSV